MTRRAAANGVRAKYPASSSNTQPIRKTASAFNRMLGFFPRRKASRTAYPGEADEDQRAEELPERHHRRRVGRVGRVPRCYHRPSIRQEEDEQEADSPHAGRRCQHSAGNAQRRTRDERYPDAQAAEVPDERADQFGLLAQERRGGAFPWFLSRLLTRHVVNEVRAAVLRDEQRFPGDE